MIQHGYNFMEVCLCLQEKNIQKSWLDILGGNGCLKQKLTIVTRSF